MKNLKTLIFCCFASAYFLACNPEYCNTNCGANGTCLDGICSCSDGYEGNYCDALSNTKFIGRWKQQTTHQHNGITDSIKIDWKVEGTSQPTDLKIINANGTANILKLKGEKLTVQNEIVLDSTHIIHSGTATINKAHNFINYEFHFKAIGANDAFYANGSLIKQ